MPFSSTMGDPFSVAGTAVGITSLGIQTCQILYKYYSQYKGYHEDIDAVLRQVEGLQGILDSLRQVKERFKLDNHAPSSQLHLALVACEEALGRLKEMADKCNTTQQAEGLKDRLRNVRKRLAWPYREETLAGLQATLTRFQDNLSLALQSAGLDVVLNRVETLQPALNNLQTQSTRIASDLDKQAGTLEVLHQGVTGLTQVQQQHASAWSNEVSELHAQISGLDAVIRSKLDILVCCVASFSRL
jgi:chromosome segregation ATPase